MTKDWGSDRFVPGKTSILLFISKTGVDRIANSRAIENVTKTRGQIGTFFDILSPRLHYVPAYADLCPIQSHCM